jgi:low affinity Fe/Cu permease
MEPIVSSRTPLSRVLHRLDHVVATAAGAAVVAGVVVAFLVGLAVAGFPDQWEMAFSTVVSALTLVMVFVLHHTQRREQLATQLKLDELVRAIPQADDHFVLVQAAEDEELEELEQRHLEHHRVTRGA